MRAKHGKRRNRLTYRPTEREVEAHARRIDLDATPEKWMVIRHADNGAWSFDCNPDGGVYYWQTEDDAKHSIACMSKTSQAKRTIRRLKERELAEINDCLILVKPKKEIAKMAKKTTSIGCLVDIFEDYETRKFAIATKASTEEEFVVEVAEAMASSSSDAWGVRLREMLPLIVDMCCKYRGYKAERVLERRELVAGDLEIPTQSGS